MHNRVIKYCMHNNKDRFYIDALKEICSIGGGHAVTSLSKIVGKKTTLNIPDAGFEPFDGKRILSDSRIVIMVEAKFKEGKKAVIFHLLPLEDAKLLTSEMMGMKVETVGEMKKSALEEIANILSGSIVGSLSNFIGEKVLFEQPKMVLSNPEEVVMNRISRQRKELEKSMYAKVSLIVEGDIIREDLVFVPFFDLVSTVVSCLKKKKVLGEEFSLKIYGEKK